MQQSIKIDISRGSFDGDPFNIIDALYWACYYGHVPSVKVLLLANGADPEKGPIHITTDAPVIHAACFGDTSNEATMEKIYSYTMGYFYMFVACVPQRDVENRRHVGV
ncbi:hypothetical protein OROHE_007143 [Orobanche hederae]